MDEEEIQGAYRYLEEMAELDPGEGEYPEDEDSEDYDCPVCLGTGYLEENLGPCKVCYGTGWITEV